MTATGLLELSHLAKSYYSVRREGPNSDHQCQMRFPWASDWTMARPADVLGVAVDRPQILETTALGVAWLAGSAFGLWPDCAGFAKAWSLDRLFQPGMDPAERKALMDGWADAVSRSLIRPEGWPAAVARAREVKARSAKAPWRRTAAQARNAAAAPVARDGCGSALAFPSLARRGPPEAGPDQARR